MRTKIYFIGLAPVFGTSSVFFCKIARKQKKYLFFCKDCPSTSLRFALQESSKFFDIFFSSFSQSQSQSNNSRLPSSLSTFVRISSFCFEFFLSLFSFQNSLTPHYSLTHKRSITHTYVYTYAQSKARAAQSRKTIF